MKNLVYVAGPLTKQPYKGVRIACVMADRIVRAGGIPILPQLSALWAMSTDQAAIRTRSEWLEIDFAILTRCNPAVRLPPEEEPSS
jgi:hypothetical protein